MYNLISEEIDKIRRKYLSSAEEITGDYHKESSLSKDYEGRQIFELLQNADDEALGSTGKVLISFDGDTLTVSNTGTPFSFPGIKSLLYPYASPKKIHAEKIGCKGLGFRSILTWTDDVIVATDEFTIQFSKEYAKEFYNGIIAENPSLIDGIKTLTKDPYPIATLTCPHLLNDRMLVDGYSTSIIMKCHQNLKETIETQIESLKFEELVFLPNLKEIEIVGQDYHKVFFKIVENDEVIIETIDKNTEETECVRWKLYKKTDNILDDDGNEKKYEFIIAFDPTGEKQGDVLYSYFKTDIKLGFPALIHGTFELTSDRNSLRKESEVNKQLFPLLAEFMVKTAVDISKEREECDYRPLSLIISPDIDGFLVRNYDFDRLLRNLSRKVKILPSVCNEYISLNDNPLYSAMSFADIVRPERFTQLLKVAESKYIENYIVNDLDIDFYDYDEFCNLINIDAEGYSMEEKVRLIALINAEYKYINGKAFPHLIVDNNGISICDESKVFPFPNEEQVIDLPNWVEIRFLNQEMEEMLHEILKTGKNRRYLINQLSRYNMEDYSFESILRGVINQAGNDLTSAERCSDVLNWLWKYYSQGNHQDIKDVNVKVICRDGEIRNAKECYLGVEYNNELGERLIRIFSENFVVWEGLKLKCSEPSKSVPFLEWLGVSRFPRLTWKNLSKDERSSYVKTCYPLYVESDGCSYEYEEFNDITNVTVGFFDHLDEILEKADFNDVLAWFVIDDDVYTRLINDTEEENDFSHIQGYKGSSRRGYAKSVNAPFMKSYLRYYLSSKEWITDKWGNKRTPEYCCYEELSLAPFIIAPNVDYDSIKAIVGDNCKKEIDLLLEKVGVRDYFVDLSNKVVYEALQRLPELDPECKKAKSIYRRIIRVGKDPDEYSKDNRAYNLFLECGSVVARKNGEKKYVLASEARYADNKVFGEDVLRNFYMFDVDAHSGADKIRKLFGVKSLEYTDVEIFGTPELHQLDEAFKREYQYFLPFVFVGRMDLKSANRDFRNLRTSKIILCKKATIQYKFGEDTRYSELGEYELVYLKDKNIAYMCVPDKYDSFSELRQVFEFAESIAELITMILKIPEGKEKEFYRDLFLSNETNREKKMMSDRGDDDLEQLNEARKKFRSASNLRDDFWLTILDVMKKTSSDNTLISADGIIKSLKRSPDIDSGVNYDNLNNDDSIASLIPVFKSLGLDVEDYNSVSSNSISAIPYWTRKLKTKMIDYRSKYQAYLYEDYKDEEDCVRLYNQFLDEYDYLKPELPNSFFVDINNVFREECGVTFKELEKYDAETVQRQIQCEFNKLSVDDKARLTTKYSSQKYNTYLLFGRVKDLLDPKPQVNVGIEHESEQEQDNTQDILSIVFSTPPSGFDDVETEAVPADSSLKNKKKKGNHKKVVHSEETDTRKQKIGLIGEACVFNELSKLYPNARWISGNAEKAGLQEKKNCDDSCGYDMEYIDNEGNIQYVEVKASTSEDISFSISINELQFGINHAQYYEIIFVVIGDDDLPVSKPWRLGHIFNLNDGEDFFHNDRFSVENDSYTIVAKLVDERD